MALMNAIPALFNFHAKRTGATPRYLIQGQGEVTLSQSDFVARGGEGAVYARGSRAYKIYTDPARVIAPAKIIELSALTRPNIIRPLEVLLDPNNLPVGYSMRHVSGGFALCQLSRY